MSGGNTMSLDDKNLDKLLIAYNQLDDSMKEYIDEDEWATHIDLIRKIVKRNKLLKQHKPVLKLFDNLSDRIIQYPIRQVVENLEEYHDYTINQYDHIIKKYVEIKNL